MADLRSQVQLLGEGIQQFLEKLRAPDEPGRFRAEPGVAPPGRAGGLAPSCHALRLTCTLDLWPQVEPAQREGWIAFIRSYQAGAGDPTRAAAFVDSADPAEAADARRAPAPEERRRWWWRRQPRIDWRALQATRRAVSALLLVGAYPEQPYRALPRTPAELRAALRCLDWRSPSHAAAQAARLVVLLCTQTPHFLELTEIRQLKACCASYFDDLADRETGGYADGRSVSPRSELLCAAGHVLDALEWLDLPPHWPQPLIESCLAAPPPAAGAELADWVRVLYHCARFTDHRRSDLQALGPEGIERLLAYRQPDGGLDDPADRGRPGASLRSTARLAAALAMWQELCSWDGPRWAVLRH